MDRGARGEQLEARRVLGEALGLLVAVEALEDALLHTLGHGGLHLRLVVDGQVVEDVLGLGPVHPAQALADDHGDLVRERRVVTDRRRVRRGDQVRVAVGVLEALARHGRTAGGRADHEAAAELVGERPELVGRPLPPEHRVEDVERDHRLAVRRVRGRGGGEVGQRTGLGDPLVQDLTVLGLLVVQELVAVDRVVRLALGRIEPGGREERLHAEGAGLVGDDRDPAAAGLLLPHQVLDEPDERHGGGDLLRSRALLERLEGFRGRLGQRLRDDLAGRGGAAERGAALAEVGHLGGVLAGVRVRHGAVGQRAVRDGQPEQVAHVAELLAGELLHLVVGVARLEARAQGVALDGLREDHRRRALVLHGGAVGGVHLARLVTGAGGLEQLQELGVGELLGHRPQRRVGAEEVVAQVRGVARRVRLELGVRGLAQPAYERAVGVAGEEVVPGGAPQGLDDVPARGAELGLQLLHDLEVGADGAVEALEVAVDDEGEVVQALPAGQRERGRGLGLVHLAVAEERPDPGAGGVLDPAVLQIAVEARLVDRGERAEAHGDGGELPQPGQSAGVRVGGQAVAVRLLAEPVELPLGEAAFEEGAGVDAGGGVALEVELVAGAAGGRVVLATEEVLEAGLVQPGGGGVGGDVAAEAESAAAGHHRGGVPPVVGGDPALHLLVARIVGLRGGGDGVDVLALQQRGELETGALAVLQGAAHEVGGAVRACRGGDGVERLAPLGRLLGIDVRELVELAVRLAHGIGHGVGPFPDEREVEGRQAGVAPTIDDTPLIDDRSMFHQKKNPRWHGVTRLLAPGVRPVGRSTAHAWSARLR